jgi:hypothetical protein
MVVTVCIQEGRYPGPDGKHGLQASRLRELHRPLPTRNRVGVTLGKMAEQGGMTRTVLARLMQHHGYLEMVPYGRSQSRLLVTSQAFAAELGHNVDPGAMKVTRLDSHARTAVFPVFYPEVVYGILWTLDWQGIVDRAAGIRSKKPKLEWLLVHHSHLPDQTLAHLGGYSLRGIKAARGRSEKVHSQVITGPTVRAPAGGL